MDIENKNDITRAWINGYKIAGRIGLFGKLKAYKNADEFKRILDEMNKSLKDCTTYSWQIFNINEIMKMVK